MVWNGPRVPAATITCFPITLENLSEYHADVWSNNVTAQGYEVQLEVDWGLAVKLGVALIARSGGTVFQVYSGAGISERNYHL